MYLTCGIPCADCCRGIINAGIQTIVCEVGDVGAKGPKWEESGKRSLQMFNEAGVKIQYYE
jgi:deoxycytidylate deaminase